MKKQGVGTNEMVLNEEVTWEELGMRGADGLVVRCSEGRVCGAVSSTVWCSVGYFHLECPQSPVRSENPSTVVKHPDVVLWQGQHRVPAPQVPGGQDVVTDTVSRQRGYGGLHEVKLGLTHGQAPTIPGGTEEGRSCYLLYFTSKTSFFCWVRVINQKEKIAFTFRI